MAVFQTGFGKNYGHRVRLGFLVVNVRVSARVYCQGSVFGLWLVFTFHHFQVLASGGVKGGICPGRHSAGGGISRDENTEF